MIRPQKGYKKIWSFVMAAAMLTALLPTTALAESTPSLTNWADAEGVSGKTFTAQASEGIETYTYYAVDKDEGTVTATTVTIDKTKVLGTEQNPIGISSEEELILFGQQQAGTKDGKPQYPTAGKFYILDKPNGVYDMKGDSRYMLPLFATVADTSSDMPAPDNSFAGTLVGNGATIQNAKIGDYSTKKGVYEGGLFSYTYSAQICGLTLKGSTVYADSSVSVSSDSDNAAGGLVGVAGSTILADCHVAGITLENAEKYATNIGGMVGLSDRSFLFGCTAQSDIALTWDRAPHNLNVGGLAGCANASIVNCTVTSNVTVKIKSGNDDKYADLYVGGIAGYADTILNSCHSGAVSATYDGETTNDAVYLDIGGIAGDATAVNCWHKGDITGSIPSGENTGVYAGGISGNPEDITNCYWNGTDQVVGYQSDSCQVSGCGTIGADADNVITAGTAENCGKVQTLALGVTELSADAMNASRNAVPPSDTDSTFYPWTGATDPQPLGIYGSATVTAADYKGKTVYLDTSDTKTANAIPLAESTTTPGSYSSEDPAAIPYGRYYVYVYSGDQQITRSANAFTVNGLNHTTTITLPPHTHCVCGGTINSGNHTTHSEVTYTPWDGNGAIDYTSNAASIYLTQDVVLTGSLTVPAGKTLNLCLNGYKLDANGGAFSAIQVEQNGTLNLCDCNKNRSNSISTYSWDETAKGWKASDPITVQGGVVTGGNVPAGGSSTGGGGICNLGTLCMYGGTVAGNRAVNYGGGIFNLGSFTLYGGAIQNNGARGISNDGLFDYGTGGGIYTKMLTATAPSLVLYGGTITQNLAGNNGAGVFAGSGATISLGGNTEIFDNINAPYSTNLYLDNNTKLTILGEMQNTRAIGINMWTPGVFTQNGSGFAGTVSDYLAKFTSDSSSYQVTTEGAQLKLVEQPPYLKSGADQSFIIGSDNDLVFTSTADILDLEDVEINKQGETPIALTEGGEYTAKAGSTIITLKNSYLKTLEPGTYTVSIVSYTGTVSTTFTIAAATDTTANTGKTVSDNTLNAWVTAGGNITPGGISTVKDGANVTYTITPNAGYKITDVKVDGVSVGAVSSYTFSNIYGNHEIGAYFDKAGATATKTSVTVPATGDTENLMLYAVLAVVSLLGLGTVGVMAYKNRKNG